MQKIQPKSPCCRGNIWRRGERRRQCSLCKKSWRIRKKNLGRKKRRYNNFSPLFHYLKGETGPLRFQAEKRNITPSAMRARMQHLVQKFNESTLWPSAPKNSLIAVADAMVEYINDIPHIVYFILLRDFSSNKAVICPFFVTIGIGEGLYGWKSAFNAIPDNVRKRIRVLVCDGLQSFRGIAHNEGWILQRCHFHLRARLVHNCSIRRFGHRPKFSRRILQLCDIILKTGNEKQLNQALNQLELMKKSITSRSFRSVISGFLKNYEEYRAYLYFPEMHLPTTSNTVENLIGQIRNLQRRAKGFRSLKSLTSWIEAYCKFTKTVTCNGKINAPS